PATSHVLQRPIGVVAAIALEAGVLASVGVGQALSATGQRGIKGPRVTRASAFDVSRPLRDLATPNRSKVVSGGLREIRPDRGPVAANRGASADGALQSSRGRVDIPAPIANFEGLSNQDNFDVFGFRVNPPDNDGDVGPNHYVQLINLVLGVFDKSGNKLLGPVAIGSLWDGFAIPDCTDPSGDPIALYDQFVDRWVLTQFTTSGL